MYGMPQPTQYGQYGFGGYAGAPGAPAPGMPQAGATGGLGLGVGQQPGADLSAAAAGQAAQAQWGNTDPNSYYSNYWGGEYSFPRSLIESQRLSRLLRPSWSADWPRLSDAGTTVRKTKSPD